LDGETDDYGGESGNKITDSSVQQQRTIHGKGGHVNCGGDNCDG
jgi:hypothetical protein